MGPGEIEQDILNDLIELGDISSQFTYLIGCAHDCEPMPEQYYTEQYLVRECQVNTWLYAEWKDDISIFWADSESLIVKGALSLLQEIFTRRSKQDMLKYKCTLLDQKVFNQHFTREQLVVLRAVVNIWNVGNAYDYGED